MTRPPSTHGAHFEAWMAKRPGPNHGVTVNPGECLVLAEAADFALHFALATLNNLHNPKLVNMVGQELARHLVTAQQRLYDALIPFRDRAGRCADGLYVQGPGIRGAGDAASQHPGALAPWSHRRGPTEVARYAIDFQIHLSQTPLRHNRDGDELPPVDEPCVATVIDTRTPGSLLMALPNGSTFWSSPQELDAQEDRDGLN